jgi:hypothetical protein
VVPSAPDDSLVVQRSELPQGDDDRMPPPGEPPIVQGEVDLLRSWVALGAAEDTQAETRSLSAAAVAVLADMLDNPRKDRSADGEAAAELRAKSGGCAACAVGSKGGGGGEGWALALCASLLLLARRTV